MWERGWTVVDGSMDLMDGLDLPPIHQSTNPPIQLSNDPPIRNPPIDSSNPGGRAGPLSARALPRLGGRLSGLMFAGVEMSLMVPATRPAIQISFHRLNPRHSSAQAGPASGNKRGHLAVLVCRGISLRRRRWRYCLWLAGGPRGTGESNGIQHPLLLEHHGTELFCQKSGATLGSAFPGLPGHRGNVAVGSGAGRGGVAEGFASGPRRPDRRGRKRRLSHFGPDHVLSSDHSRILALGSPAGRKPHALGRARALDRSRISALAYGNRVAVERSAIPRCRSISSPVAPVDASRNRAGDHSALGWLGLGPAAGAVGGQVERLTVCLS